MQVFKGMRVFIKPTSMFYRDSDGSNPKDMGGVITSMTANANTEKCRDFLGITVTWDNGRHNTYHRTDLEVRKGAIPIGSVVRIHESSQFHGTGNNNPAELTGTVVSHESYLGHRVEWSNGSHNTYRTDDLVVVTLVKPEEKPKQVDKIRLVMSAGPINDGKPTRPVYAYDTDKVDALPRRAHVAGFGCSSVELAFSRPFHELATGLRDLTDFPYIYMMKDGKVFKMEDKPTYIGESRVSTAQLEVGKLYNLSNPHTTIFPSGTIVELVEQEPEDYTGPLPYLVKRVNSDTRDWIGRKSVLTLI